MKSFDHGTDSKRVLGCQSIPEVPQGTLSVLNIAMVSFYGTTPTIITSMQGQKTIYW